MRRPPLAILPRLSHHFVFLSAVHRRVRLFMLPAIASATKSALGAASPHQLEILAILETQRAIVVRGHVLHAVLGRREL